MKGFMPLIKIVHWNGPGPLHLRPQSVCRNLLSPLKIEIKPKQDSPCHRLRQASIAMQWILIFFDQSDVFTKRQNIREFYIVMCNLANWSRQNAATVWYSGKKRSFPLSEQKKDETAGWWWHRADQVTGMWHKVSNRVGNAVLANTFCKQIDFTLFLFV